MWSADLSWKLSDVIFIVYFDCSLQQVYQKKTSSDQSDFSNIK